MSQWWWRRGCHCLRLTLGACCDWQAATEEALAQYSSTTDAIASKLPMPAQALVDVHSDAFKAAVTLFNNAAVGATSDKRKYLVKLKVPLALAVFQLWST